MSWKKSFINAILLTSFVIFTGCAATGNYKNDHSRFQRIASRECISFGHVFDSDGYNQCMEKRLREVLPRVMMAARTQRRHGGAYAALSIATGKIFYL